MVPEGPCPQSHQIHLGTGAMPAPSVQLVLLKTLAAKASRSFHNSLQLAALLVCSWGFLPVAMVAAAVAPARTFWVDPSPHRSLFPQVRLDYMSLLVGYGRPHGSRSEQDRNPYSPVAELVLDLGAQQYLNDTLSSPSSEQLGESCWGKWQQDAPTVHIDNIADSQLDNWKIQFHLL